MPCGDFYHPLPPAAALCAKADTARGTPRGSEEKLNHEIHERFLDHESRQFTRMAHWREEPGKGFAEEVPCKQVYRKALPPKPMPCCAGSCLKRQLRFLSCNPACQAVALIIPSRTYSLTYTIFKNLAV